MIVYVLVVDIGCFKRIKGITVVPLRNEWTYLLERQPSQCFVALLNKPFRQGLRGFNTRLKNINGVLFDTWIIYTWI